jgi:hypothetical protein
VLREPTKHHVAGLGRDGHHRSPNRGAGSLPGLEPLLSGSRVTTSMDIRQAETIDKQQQAVVDTLNTRGHRGAFVSGARQTCRQPLSTLALVRKIIWSLGDQSPLRHITTVPKCPPIQVYLTLDTKNLNRCMSGLLVY